jgi:hypothetical protein
MYIKEFWYDGAKFVSVSSPSIGTVESLHFMEAMLRSAPFGEKRLMAGVFAAGQLLPGI